MHDDFTLIRIGDRDVALASSAALVERAEKGSSHVDKWIIGLRDPILGVFTHMTLGVPLSERDENGNPSEPTVEYVLGMIAQGLAFAQTVGDVMSLSDHDLDFVRECTGAMIELSAVTGITANELIVAFLDVER